LTSIYLNLIASALGSSREINDPATLLQSPADCERLVQKTGVHSRPVAGPGEQTSDLAIRAARKLIEVGPYAASDIDTLVVCTQTPDHLIPGVSSRVHGALGLAENCCALDINQGCSGFIYGVHVLSAMMRGGASERAMLVNADTYSRLLRSDDLTTRVLFGDAATASILSKVPGGFRLVSSRCYSDGTGYEDFVARGSALSKDEAFATGIHMDGANILRFALRVVPGAVADSLRDNGLDASQVRMFAFHQANSFVIGKLAYKMGLTPEQVPQNCAELGNTVSASIPLLLMDQVPSLKTGDRVLAVGFGVGLSWATALLEYSEPGHTGD